MADINRTLQKAVRYLREKGVRETLNRTKRHFGRKRAERRFVRNMQLTEEEMQRQRAEQFDKPLRFSVIVPLYNTPMDLLKEMTDSVLGQTYPQWELCLADGSDGEHAEVGDYCTGLAEKDGRIRYRKLEKNGGISENSNACLELASGDYFALFDHDDVLTSNALYEMRKAIDATRADFLYSDELIFRSPNRKKIIGIRLKPGFSPDSLLTNNYICHMTVFSRELLEKTGGFRKAYDGSQDHDLILRLTNRAKGIAHVSKVLYLWRSVPTSVASDINSKRYAIEAGRSAVEAFLREEKGIQASVESTEVFPTMYRVKYPIEGTPSVRVILDGREEGISEKAWKALRDSAGWDRTAWTVILRSEEPAFSPGDKSAEITWMKPENGESRARLWNRAARECREDYLLFIDGVPEAAEEGWLRELLSHAQHFHVGAAAPRIHFRQGEIRHAGVVIGLGPERLAGRPYHMGDEDSEGYFGQLAVVENVSAVTDCLMISREKWLGAGMFCEEYEDALFDVDLCLRLLETGLYNVYTPHARMKLGKARDVYVDVGREYASYPRDREVFRKRNEQALKRTDPYFHPALSLKHEDWRIS